MNGNYGYKDPYSTGMQGSMTSPSIKNSVIQQHNTTSSNPFAEAINSTAGYFPLAVRSGSNQGVMNWQRGPGYRQPVDPGSRIPRPPQQGGNAQYGVGIPERGNAQWGVGISDGPPQQIGSPYPPGAAQNVWEMLGVPQNAQYGVGIPDYPPAPGHSPRVNHPGAQYGVGIADSAPPLDANGNPVLTIQQIMNAPINPEAKMTIGGKNEQAQPLNGAQGQIGGANGNTGINGAAMQAIAQKQAGGAGAYPSWAQNFFRGEQARPLQNAGPQQVGNPDPGGYQPPPLPRGGTQGAGGSQGGGYGVYSQGYGAGGNYGGSFNGGSHPRGDYTQGNDQYLQDLQKKISDYYTNVGQQGERSLRGAAALTNMQDSGAFGTALGNYYQNLGAEQGKEGANAMFTANENNQQRLLQNALAQISANASMYGADRGAQAQLGSARIGANASMYGNDTQRELGYANLDVNREQYGNDSLMRWYQMLLGQMGGAANYGPESLLGGNQIPNGAIYIPAGNGGH